MLTQMEADNLLAMRKQLVQPGPILFPIPGELLKLDARSVDGREAFIIDVNRKGRIRATKCTYQERYSITEILLRLDIDGPPHDNPDGTTLPCPHLHVYREGWADKWATPLPASRFADLTDLAQTLHDFLAFCNILDIPRIQRGVL